MPNQNNFRSDVTNTQEIRYSASRIVRVPEELILFEEVPASFAFDREDNVEIHFYTIPANQLITSTVVKVDEEIVKSHILAYQDNTYKNFIRFDITKLFVDKNLVLIPGDYRMVMNFFSDEIGSYNDRRLTIETISTSRTEVELTFNNTRDDIIKEENIYLAKEFVDPSFNRPDAVGVAEKIFSSGVQLNDSGEGITAEVVVENIEVEEIQQTYVNTVARIDRTGIREHFDQKINEFLPELYKFIREEIVINSDERIQQEEYKEIIKKIVEEKIINLRQIMDPRIKVS